MNYWNAQQGDIETLVDILHTEQYKQAITLNAPYFMQYLTATVLLVYKRLRSKHAVCSKI
jgi:hypothetical protein